MQYISTRGQDGPLGYEAALLSGLARDGGLYLPVDYPRFTADEIRDMSGLSYAALAGRIMACFTDGEIGGNVSARHLLTKMREFPPELQDTQRRAAHLRVAQCACARVELSRV